MGSCHYLTLCPQSMSRTFWTSCLFSSEFKMLESWPLIKSNEMKTAGLLKWHEITTCNLISRKLECRCLLCPLVYHADGWTATRDFRSFVFILESIPSLLSKVAL